MKKTDEQIAKIAGCFNALNGAWETFSAEAGKACAGNASAGKRARKASILIEKLLKEFRKVSV